MSRPTGRAFWGPPVWTTIHVVATALQHQNIQHFKDFLSSLSHLLPCDQCNKHFAQLLKEHPMDWIRNEQDAFHYTYKLHDMVNRNISKLHPSSPKVSPLEDTLKEFYSSTLYPSKGKGESSGTKKKKHKTSTKQDEGENQRNLQKNKGDFKSTGDTTKDVLLGDEKRLVKENVSDPTLDNHRNTSVLENTSNTTITNINLDVITTVTDTNTINSNNTTSHFNTVFVSNDDATSSGKERKKLDGSTSFSLSHMGFKKYHVFKPSMSRANRRGFFFSESYFFYLVFIFLIFIFY
eukprot:TRINITY_DN17724_c0_g1_i1.p1 TRINITY_DN17724_c0_g1~~TRINITY_DN17724_c0_g1_i1.p1  ORF type:complete len:293 (-),score=55.48 TRINITY_DN17724_c0_g1_i1:192-1070(-)